MRILLIQKILGLFLILYSVTLIPPIIISLLYQDGEILHFLLSTGLTLLAGLILWLPVRNHHMNIQNRDGFIIVAMFWVVLGLLSALPFLFGTHLNITDAFFESVSAFTTTGATVITGLDNMPPSILFYRQQLQWFGGMGVIVLAIAILPMLGIGGMQLYRAETPGPFKDEKIAPRIAHCARSFWMIYTVLTLSCAAAYWIAGMSLFDALAHSLTTISTGGFSTHDASLAYFDSPAIDMIAVVFMILGGTNFSIHFYALLRGRPLMYWRDIEVRMYLILLVFFSLLAAAELFRTHYHNDIFSALRFSLFQTVSVMTTTGYVTEDFSVWPDFIPSLLFFISFIGGCAGSTAGGIKVIRFIIMFKQSGRDLNQLLHPAMEKPLKIAGRVLPERIIDAVWGYFSLYVASFALIMLLLMADGMDQITAFSAVTTSINNLGPGLGAVASNFKSVTPEGKWILAFAMLLGRLEVFTLLVFFAPSFWRK